MQPSIGWIAVPPSDPQRSRVPLPTPRDTHPGGSQVHALGLTRHRWSDHRDKRCDEEDGCEDTSTVLGARLPGGRLRP